jgi:hypothetical protein
VRNQTNYFATYFPDPKTKLKGQAQKLAHVDMLKKVINLDLQSHVAGALKEIFSHDRI